MPPPNQRSRSTVDSGAEKVKLQDSLMRMALAVENQTEAYTKARLALDAFESQANKASSQWAMAGRTLGVYFLSKIPGVGRYLEGLGNAALALGRNMGQGKGIGGKAGNLAAGVAMGAPIFIETALAAITEFGNKVVSIAASATPGGLDTINKSFQILSATIGAHLAPVIPMISAGVLTLADVLGEFLSPLFESMPKIFQDAGMSIKTFFEYVIDGLRMLTKAARAIKEEPGKLAQAGGLGGLMHSKVGGMFGLNEQTKTSGDTLDKVLEKMSKWNGPSFNVDERYSKNRDDSIKNIKAALASSLGGGPKFSDLGSVWKDMQTGSYRSPFEMKMIELMTQAVKNTERGANAAEVGGRAGYVEPVWGKA